MTAEIPPQTIRLLPRFDGDEHRTARSAGAGHRESRGDLHALRTALGLSGGARADEGGPMAGFANLVFLDLECPDPRVLAEFYHQVLGWDIALSQDEYAEITDGSTRILFTRVDDYQASGWPTSAAPKRYHLCLETDDVAEAVKRSLALGAGMPEFQPGADRWTVLTDPAGHPFCLAQAG
jgi:predicted enzyme related to lactoylglutathione lyase